MIDIHINANGHDFGELERSRWNRLVGVSSKIAKDHFLKDLDQKSRSLDQSWSLAPKDHFKIIDLDQFQDQDQDHFTNNNCV